MTIKNTETIALLPIKGHSERIQGKNFRTFLDKPLFQWILKTLLAIDEISKIVINTDCKETLFNNGLVLSDRILIRDRKPELCGDFVSMNKIIEYDVKNIPADIYIMTHTTNPLIQPNTISSALNIYKKALLKGKADSLFSVNRFQTRFYKSDGKPINHDPDNLIRTQDLEPWYEENSNLYIFTKDSSLKTRSRIGSNPIMFEMPRWESVEIDDQESWDLAEMIAKTKVEN